MDSAGEHKGRHIANTGNTYSVRDGVSELTDDMACEFQGCEKGRHLSAIRDDETHA